MKFIKKHQQNLLVLLIFIIGVAIFYGNTLRNGFVNDDHGVIETNPYVHSLKYLPKVITGCTWNATNGNCNDNVLYRPLVSLSYLLTYQISSSPWSFALARLVYFAIDLFLIFILAKLLTKNFLVGLLSSLIFLINPINTEAVNFSAPDLLCTIFVLLSVIFYFLYRSRKKLYYSILTYVFYGLGILSKEHAVFIIFIFLTLDLTYFKKKISWFFKKKNVKPYIVCAIIGLIYMGLRSLVLGSFIKNNPDRIADLTFAQHVFAFFYLFSSYVKELFWPYPLKFWHTFNSSYKFWDLHFLSYFLITFGYVWGGFLAWKKRQITVLFALVWFFVFLVPGLIFVQSLGKSVFAERYMFVPLVGFSILIAILLERLWMNWSRGKTVVTVLMIVFSLLSFFYIYKQNKVWQNDISLNLNVLKYEPDNEQVRHHLATVYRYYGDLVSAKKQLVQIIKRGTWKDLYKAYFSLGDIYYQEGKYELASDNFQTSIKLNPMHKESYNNLGALSLERGRLLESLPYLCKALLIDPSFKDANTNFNFISSKIQGMDNETFTILHNQMLENTVFKPSPNKDALTLQNKNCTYKEGCVLMFKTLFKPSEFIFPFLIFAKTPADEVVRMRYFSFNQTKEGYQMALGIDRKFSNSRIHFYIPTCEGIYYETETQ